ncbi:MAG: M55 family metallopeptidase [Fimbriimonadaceae bacterium]|nr:M55 family metallopeptidase [Fimbriimonadaceae bacterium]
MRVYISGDIEGITGIVSWSQAEGPTNEAYDFAFARQMYTHDLNAAIRGARAAGASKVVVKDSHGWCKNILVSDLEPDVELISGYGRMPHGMMEGIQEGFDAAILVGYHAMAGHRGLMAHALVGGLHRFWINGEEAGEIAFSVGLAGSYGVPLVAVTSDDAGCSEAEATIKGVRTYAVKVALGSFITRLKHPSVTGPGIEATVREAVSTASQVQPYRFDGPVTMRIQFQNANQAELPPLMDGVSILDPYTLEWTGSNFLAAARRAVSVFEFSRAGRGLQD